MIEIGIGHFKETFEQYLSHDDRSYLDPLIYYQCDANAQPALGPLVCMVQGEGPCPTSLLSLHNPWTERQEKVGGDSGPRFKVQVAYEFLSFSLHSGYCCLFLIQLNTYEYLGRST